MSSSFSERLPSAINKQYDMEHQTEGLLAPLQTKVLRGNPIHRGDCEQDGVRWTQGFGEHLNYRYRDLFERRTKRKSADGSFKEWCDGEPRPNIVLYYPAYREAEEQVAADFYRIVQNSGLNTG